MLHQTTINLPITTCVPKYLYFNKFMLFLLLTGYICSRLFVLNVFTVTVYLLMFYLFGECHLLRWSLFKFMSGTQPKTYYIIIH